MEDSELTPLTPSLAADLLGISRSEGVYERRDGTDVLRSVNTGCLVLIL